MKNQRGLTVFWIIFILVIIFLAGVAYWYWSDNRAQPLPSVTVTTSNESTGTFPVAGYYAHTVNPEDGYILVSQTGDTISLEGYAEYTSAYGVTHYGALGATTTVDENNVANLDLSPGQDRSCEMTLAFASSSVEVHQTASGLSCGFGENVEYFGTYYKQSNTPANLPFDPSV